MSDFPLMRENMVKNQVLPENVTHPSVLEALLHIPREQFVPRQFSRSAYMDANFTFSQGRVLLRPATLARLLEALNPKPSDHILYLAAGTGYGPALLGHIGSHVVALDEDEVLTREAENHLQNLGLSTVDVICGPLSEGWEKEAPYDKILIEGCVSFIPTPLINQLKERGILVTLRETLLGRMEAIKYIKNQGVLTGLPLFDAFGSRVRDLQKTKAFVF